MSLQPPSTDRFKKNCREYNIFYSIVSAQFLVSRYLILNLIEGDSTFFALIIFSVTQPYPRLTLNRLKTSASQTASAVPESHGFKSITIVLITPITRLWGRSQKRYFQLVQTV